MTLSHALAADEGCRVVFDHLAWGAEFPESDFAAVPPPLQQALATPSMLAAATGTATGDSAAAAVDVSDGSREPSAAVDPSSAAASATPSPQGPPPSGRLQGVDHQALRDTLLLYDGVAMLIALLTGKPLPASGGASRASPRFGDAGKSAAAAALREEAVHCSSYLTAILDACAHPTSPPSLRQLLSHPYFAPVEGFDKEDVRAAYRRWRRQQSTLDKLNSSIFGGTALG